MDWKSISNGVVEGLTTALVWALLLWIWQIVKMYKIRFGIRKSLTGTNALFWKKPDIFGIILKNNSAWPVVIRQAGFLLASGVEVKCGYIGTKAPVYEDHILLKPKTEDRWGFPIEGLDAEIKIVWIEYEYDTLLGRNRVERVEIGNDLSRRLENHRVQIRKSLENQNGA